MSDVKVEKMSPTVSGTSLAHRIFHPPKLERKHSSGDLHSRLKTRKILGVGETDNGDIHRSKISQLLGHNEHLYVKLPRGFCIWHLAMAFLVTVQGLVAVMFPQRAGSLIFLQAKFQSGETTYAYQMSGAAILGLAVFLWSVQGTNDKAQARSSLTAIVIYTTVQIIVGIVSIWHHGIINYETVGTIFVKAFLALVCIFYHGGIGRSTAGLRKSSSYKDLSIHTLEKANNNADGNGASLDAPIKKDN